MVLIGNSAIFKPISGLEGDNNPKISVVNCASIIIYELLFIGSPVSGGFIPDFIRSNAT